MPPRFLVDANLIRRHNLPAAGETSYSDPIDLGSDLPGPALEGVRLEYGVAALPHLPAEETCTITVQHSADGQSWDDMPGFSPLVVTGSLSGSLASKIGPEVFQPGALRHLRLKAELSADAGDNTDRECEFALIF